MLTAQDTRRFVLGFTLCGPLMSIWVFDRLGGIASEQFDINKDGLRFVSTILEFLWMSERMSLGSTRRSRRQKTSGLSRSNGMVRPSGSSSIE